MKLLIVEDEPNLLDAICSYLSAEGYLCERAPDYRKALSKIKRMAFDCVVVDITIPYGDGLQIIEELKTLQPDACTIIISAKNSLEDKLKGLRLGSDDYLTKPFHMPELNSRIQALNRRKNYKSNTSISFEEVRLDVASRQCWISGQEIFLTLKEFDLLLYFLSNKNRVISKSAIVEHLWEHDAFAPDTYNFLYTHIKNLRKKMMEKGAPDYIQTVYGIGYNFKPA